MDAKQIGEVIKKSRKNKKLTQAQVGKFLAIGKDVISDYENGKVKVIPFEKRAKLSSVLNIPVSELLYDNDKMACISTNEAVDELRGNRLIKAVNAELEEWLCSGDTDYLYKAMAVIRAEIDNDLQKKRKSNERTDYFTVVDILGRQNRVYKNNLLCSRPCSNCVCRDGCNGSLDR